MARVRVMAVKLATVQGAWPVPRLGYRAQLYSDDGHELLWTCGHEHTTPVEAHSCGVEQLGNPSEDQQTA